MEKASAPGFLRGRSRSVSKTRVAPRFAIVVLLLAAPALSFDIDAYCRRGPAADRARCRKDERAARAKLARKNVTPQIVKACEKKAKAAGGSYRIETDCIEEEVEALRHLAD